MRMSRVLMLAASLTFTSSVIASAAEQPKVKDVSGLAEVDLEADEYYFEPAFLRGTPGQKLKLEIENESNTLHSFTIPEQKLDMDMLLICGPSSEIFCINSSRVISPFSKRSRN